MGEESFFANFRGGDGSEQFHEEEEENDRIVSSPRIPRLPEEEGEEVEEERKNEEETRRGRKGTEGLNLSQRFHGYRERKRTSTTIVSLDSILLAWPPSLDRDESTSEQLLTFSPKNEGKN